MAELGRWESATLLDVLKLPEGNNMLDLDDLAEILGMDDPLQLPMSLAEPEALKAETASPANSGNIDAFVPPLMVMQEQQLVPSVSGDGHMADSSDQTAAAERIGAVARRSNNVSSSGAATQLGADGKVKKRRTRNQTQMEMNRQAQQKYRERKKAEYETLQSAVEMLTAQLAALKAVEVRNHELEAGNSTLLATVQQQGAAISQMEATIKAQAQELAATQEELKASQALVASQQAMILDQHTKVRLQEQIITSLKDRLKESIDDAMGHMAPGSVCEKLIAAVKSAVYGAKDMHGVQAVLEQLPEPLVVEICKNILQVCKQMWPELADRFKSQCAAGGSGAMSCSMSVPC